MIEFELRTAPGDVEFRAASNITSHTIGNIEGYASVFNTRSQLLSDDGKKVFVEQFAPGAFKKTLQENRNIFCYFNHDNRQVLGTRQSGTLDIAEDGTGLHYRCALPNTTPGRDAAAYIERGDVRGSSFQFLSMDEEFIGADEETGAPLRTVRQAKLMEVSPVFSPAYLASTVVKRSFERLAQSMDRDADEIYELALNGELRSLWTPVHDETANETTEEGRAVPTNLLAVRERELRLLKLRLQRAG